MHEKIKEKFKEIQSGDEEQLKIIFSDKKRIIVEAPAGCGKTTTMIRKIAYLIATKQICNPKRILVLTFSVNAAYKIKKEVANVLPQLLSFLPISPLEINNKVFISNYHGFCRRVLRLYGYLLNQHLTKIEYLKGIDDDDPQKIQELKIGIPPHVAEKVSFYNEAIKSINEEVLKKDFDFYLKNVEDYFLPNGYIPFNAILLFTIKLFKKFDQILEFYHTYYPIIIVDEFQDTNILGWTLLNQLITENSHLMLTGDSLQRIYGFIGAIPNIMDKAEREFDLCKFELTRNYRFIDNNNMLLLDRNIRENAKNPLNPMIKENAIVEVYEFSNQYEEANGITDLVKNILEQEPSTKIAVLVKQRNKNTSIILDLFEKKNIPYFYALYSEEDRYYIDFHQMLLQKFVDITSTYRNKFNKIICNKILEEVRKMYEKENNEFIINSLLHLLKVFLERVFTEFSFLSIEEKIDLVRDVLENKALKQYMGYVDANVVISTIHGAKGLEWDYVILPDLEQYSFPNWLGLCGKCRNQHKCEIDWDQVENDFEKVFYEELSVFYVGVTRARKKVFFTWSKKRFNYSNYEVPTKLSCLLRLPGIIIHKPKN